jgi:hypothetical protein
MKTFADFKTLIDACSYKPGWEILLKQEHGDVFLQIGVTTEAEISLDMITGERVAWRGAKHRLSPFMCDSEVIGAVFGAIRQAEEHETREWFRFKKRSIFNPHLSVHALAEVASRLANFDTRPNAMTMTEEIK